MTYINITLQFVTIGMYWIESIVLKTSAVAKQTKTLKFKRKFQDGVSKDAQPNT